MVKLLSIFLITLFLALPARAQELESCTSWPNVPVNVTPEFEEPDYDYSQNIYAIQTLANDSEHSVPQYHSIALGITRYEPVLEFRVPVMVERLPDGLACAYVQGVDVKVGYKNVMVYVASEIPRDSCGFTETLDHEKKHIAVNRMVLEEFVPLIKERFQAYLKLNGVLRMENASYAQQVIQDRLKSIVDEVSERMVAENMRRQRDVDSQAEYNRLSNVCSGDLYRIAEDYRISGR